MYIFKIDPESNLGVWFRFLLSPSEVVSVPKKTVLEDEIAVLRGKSFECGKFNWKNNNAELIIIN